MSRSKHTRPLRVKAADRMRAPYARRGRNDERRRRAVRRWLKGLGLSERDVPQNTGEGPARLPRIVETSPRAGRMHPATRADIARTLEFFGAECFYGLRSIELRQTPTSASAGLLFGRLSVPGRVLIYDQKPSPWRFSRRLAAPQLERLERAGATVETDDGLVTVSWTGRTLTDFMLFEVLMHEVGHHLLQHHKGKRTVHIARKQDHEAFAERFALRCRRAFENEGAP